MTDCTTQPLLFASDNRRQIVADFQAGDLTSDGGLPLLREVDPKIGLIDAVNAAICDPAPPLAKPPACLPAGRLAMATANITAILHSRGRLCYIAPPLRLRPGGHGRRVYEHAPG